MDSLRPFDKLNGGITMEGLRLAEQKCKISTWCHRAQVINGRLYVTDLRAIFFDRHYAMARVMPLLLAMKRFPVPDLDAVFSGTDYPIMEIPRDAAHMKRMYGPGRKPPQERERDRQTETETETETDREREGSRTPHCAPLSHTQPRAATPHTVSRRRAPPQRKSGSRTRSPP
eukprot:3952123-Prymnesium_polylepis.1